MPAPMSPPPMTVTCFIARRALDVENARVASLEANAMSELSERVSVASSLVQSALWPTGELLKPEAIVQL